jgi:hypothetical protein
MKKFLALLMLSASSYGVEVENGLPDHPEFDTIQMDITFVDGQAEGRLQWNSEDGTLEYGLPGGEVNLQVGQEMMVRAVNKTGADISNGVPVTITGQQGGRPTIVPSDADNGDLWIVSGVTTEAILDNSNGYVTTFGIVRGVDTSAFTAGSRLYCSTNAGEYVTNLYAHPINNSLVGFVLVSNPESGSIQVSPREILTWSMLDAQYAP